MALLKSFVKFIIEAVFLPRFNKKKRTELIMQYVVVSDIYGSLYYVKKLDEIINQEDSDRIILLGDIYNSDNVPPAGDVIVHGHFHTGFIKEEYGLIFANPGSISLPKNNTAHSYLIINDLKFILKDIEGNDKIRKKVKPINKFSQYISVRYLK